MTAENSLDSPIIDDLAWQAVWNRDRSFDGRFVFAVLSTCIYCRPSCAARHPKRANVRIFADGVAARVAGFRACLRCRPDDVARDVAAVMQATALIDARETPIALEQVARAVGYSPHHFHRLFKAATGITPAAYARAARAKRAEQALRDAGSITAAIFDAGYGAASGFYAASDQRLGMTPSAWRDGGRGEVIRWTTAMTGYGPMLLAATARGICRLVFDETEEHLAARFPNARIEPDQAGLAILLADVLATIEAPERGHALPLDVRGTIFQEAVWQELSRIPPGETLSYAALAARAGRPGAARAVGSACGANPVAVLIPCHRARRGDGSAGGYAWGLEMKAALLAREAGGNDEGIGSVANQPG